MSSIVLKNGTTENLTLYACELGDTGYDGHSMTSVYYIKSNASRLDFKNMLCELDKIYGIMESVAGHEESEIDEKLLTELASRNLLIEFVDIPELREYWYSDDKIIDDAIDFASTNDDQGYLLNVLLDLKKEESYYLCFSSSSYFQAILFLLNKMYNKFEYFFVEESVQSIDFGGYGLFSN